MPAKRPRATDEDDAPELTPELMALMRPVKEAAPAVYRALQEAKRGRGPQRQPTKVSLTVRLEPDAVAAYRATGRGWQSRLSADVSRAAVRLSRKWKAG